MQVRQKLSDAFVPERMVRHLKAECQGIEAEALSLRIEEFIKFLILSTKIGSGMLPVSQEIDDLWHVYIIETQEYASLCERIGAFIHHTSLDKTADELDSSARRDFHWLFIVGYVANFGPFSSDVLPLWPVVADFMAYLSFDLEGLNQFALQLSRYAAPLRLSSMILSEGHK
jgi:hypothetical protein